MSHHNTNPSPEKTLQEVKEQQTQINLPSGITTPGSDLNPLQHLESSKIISKFQYQPKNKTPEPIDI